MVSPRESRGSNRGRQAATEDRKQEKGQPLNTQNTRKSGNRKKGNHGTHRTHGSQESTEDRQPWYTQITWKSEKHGRTGNRGKGGGDRWKEVECRAAVAEGAGERMARGEGFGR